jgi:tetratricopeptide (TPR) repeat protein
MANPSSPSLDNYAKARALMARDQYLDAALILRDGLEHEFAGNPFAEVDLANCYYMLGDYVSYRKYTLRALSEYRAGHAPLRADERAGLALGLGRALEELGLVDEALRLYDASPEHAATMRSRKLLAQKLRLQSELGLHEEVRLAYLSCIQMLDEDGNEEVDFQNAMLFVDHALFGPAASLKRYAKLHLSPRLQRSDQRLLFFNLLGLVLFSPGPLETKLAGYLDSFDYFSCDPFERCLYDLARIRQGLPPFETLGLERSALLSPMCGFRFLLALSVSLPEASLLETRREFMARLESLTVPSRRLIAKAFTLPHPTLEIEVGTAEAVCAGRQIDFGKSRNALVLLSLFADKQRLTYEELSRSHFNCELDENGLSRIKMAISRLNKALSKQLGFPALIFMAKDDVRLIENVSIRRRGT